jgi:RIO kinase 1
MPKISFSQISEEGALIETGRPGRRQARRKLGYKPKRPVQQVVSELVEQSISGDDFQFSYRATRHERQWIMDSLGGFYEDRWIDDVLQLVKGGKEATVYQCAAHPSASLGGPAGRRGGAEAEEFIAAKVYRPRMFRNLKKDFIYREGRANLDSDGNVIKNHGMQNAMRKRSDYGLELLHTSWIEHEYATLRRLHQAGADVPTPYASANNAILMGFVGSEEMAAPTLNSIRLGRDEARQLFQRVLRNIEIMLANERVHADLSAYNILYWQGQITLIDFPQAISPHQNPDAYAIFTRDVQRICEYFALQGVRSQPRRLAAELWSSYQYRTGPEVHPALLDDQDEQDRRLWERLQRKL